MKFLDHTSLPSDPDGTLGNLRTSLSSAFNSSRDRPARMNLLRKTLVSVLNLLDEVDYDRLLNAAEKLDQLDDQELSTCQELVEANKKLVSANAAMKVAIERKTELLKAQLKESNSGKESTTNKPTRKRVDSKRSPSNKQTKDSK